MSNAQHPVLCRLVRFVFNLNFCKLVAHAVGVSWAFWVAVISYQVRNFIKIQMIYVSR